METTTPMLPNNIDLVDGLFGTGAIKLPPVAGIPQLSNIGGDSQPFDWKTGWNSLKITGNIPVKNQYQSYSCGGQAYSYLIEILDAIRDGYFEEKSARFIYAPCAVNGGGSSEESLINRILTVGSANESLVSSYESNSGTSEQFMETLGNVTDTVKQNALQDKGLQAVYLDPTDIDSLACAIRDHGAFVMGVRGENNGTWQSATPTKPSNNGNTIWAHWLCFVGAGLVNGVKTLYFINSWGDKVGINGVQTMTQDYLNGFTWGAATLVLVNPPKLSYTFNIDMRLGDNSSEVTKLQTKLKQLGFFPKEQSLTSYFGQITKNAVVAFQKWQGLPQTGLCLTLTRSKLNQL